MILPNGEYWCHELAQLKAPKPNWETKVNGTSKKPIQNPKADTLLQRTLILGSFSTIGTRHCGTGKTVFPTSGTYIWPTSRP